MPLFEARTHEPSTGLERPLRDAVYHAGQYLEGIGRIEPLQPMMIIAAPRPDIDDRVAARWHARETGHPNRRINRTGIEIAGAATEEAHIRNTGEIIDGGDVRPRGVDKVIP